MIVCLLLTRNIVNHRRIGHDSHARAELPSVRQQSLSPRFYISIKMQPCSSRSVKLRSLRLQHRMKGSGRMAPKGTHRGPAGGGHLDGGTPGRNSGGQTKPVDRQRLDQEMRQRRNVRFGASSTHGLNHIAERGAQANRAEIQGEVRKLHIDQAASKRKVVTNRRRPCDLCSGTKATSLVHSADAARYRARADGRYPVRVRFSGRIPAADPLQRARRFTAKQTTRPFLVSEEERIFAFALQVRYSRTQDPGSASYFPAQK
jgi:hypothetical protein